MKRIGAKKYIKTLLLNYYNNIEKINNTKLIIDKNNNLTFYNNLKKSLNRANIMKLKTTKRNIRENFGAILSIGYCSADSLLQHVNPFGYSAGVYGWACDYYDFGGVCISTGYNPIGKHVNFELLKEYEERAQKINCDYNLNYQERKETTNALLKEFISKQLELLNTNK